MQNNFISQQITNNIFRSRNVHAAHLSDQLLSTFK